MTLLRLAWHSLWNRRLTAGLLVLAIALAVTLLTGIERLRVQAEDSFVQTLSGTDLLVGARGGELELLLYAVFHLGNATHEIEWQSYQTLAELPGVAWSIPLALGDSHHGYRVVGTHADYFTRYQHGEQQPLVMAQGRAFADVFETVLGAEVASDLGYAPGSAITLAHGTGAIDNAAHANMPFRVVGVLAATGTVVDHAVYVPLAGIEAIHLGWQGGVPLRGLTPSAEQAKKLDLTPRRITAALIGLDSPFATFKVQRAINTFEDEPLQAVLPGLALQRLWGLIGTAEGGMQLMAGFVVLVSLAGLVSAHLTALEARRRELAILRGLGAHPRQILGLILGETLLLTLAGILTGLGLLYALWALAAPWVQASYGITLHLAAPGQGEWLRLGAVLLGGLAAGLLPALRAYRLTLLDGLSPRL